MAETSLAEMINEEQLALMDVKRPWYLLVEAEAELSKRIRDKPYRIHHDAVFESLISTSRMLVIDLASFTVDMLKKGGLLGQVKARSHELPRKRKPTRDDASLERLLASYHDAAFARLFGESIDGRGRGPSAAGVDELRERFDQQVQDVLSERHRHAHRHERSDKAETEKLLSMAELGEQFAHLERLLNDLRLLCESATMGYTEMNYRAARESAPYLVDLILLGCSVADDRRDRIYDELHAQHDAGSGEPVEPGDEPDLFNDFRPILRLLGPG
jgi:hypothetical protein